jgi:hypothetical protein
MRELEFSLAGLSEKTLRRRSDGRRGIAAGLLIVLASLLVLAVRPARLEPGNRDFGEQEVGSSSEIATFTLVNSSTVLSAAEVAIEGEATVDFTIDGDCAEVAANAPCQLAVRFTPITTQQRSARLVVLDSRGRALVSSELTGIGVSPPPRTITFDPPRLDFGDVEFGKRRPTAAVRVINGGPKAFLSTIDGLMADGSPAFTVLDEECTSNVLEVDAACTVNVSFDPKTVGRHAATFSVSDDLGIAHTLDISAIASRRAPPPPRKPPPAARGDAIVFSPNPAGFKTLRTGLITLPEGITLKNVSNGKFKASYGVANETFAANFILGRLCEGFFFLPGSTCREEVRYRPQTGGTHQGEISIRNEAGKVIGTLKLEGSNEAAAQAATGVQPNGPG